MTKYWKISIFTIHQISGENCKPLKKFGLQESSYCTVALKESTGTSASGVLHLQNTVSFLLAMLAREENPSDILTDDSDDVKALHHLFAWKS